MHERSTPFPSWIRRPWPSGAVFREVHALLEGLNLHTVCQSAHCPNQSECWGRGTATLMLLGNVCTRHCTYCAVNSGRPDAVDGEEPAHVAEAVRRLGLKHVVLTSVTRDDLPDGGAAHIAQTITAIKAAAPKTTIEALVQDFDGDAAAIGTVLDAGPAVFSHNIESVARLFPKLRDQRFSYRRSLDVLRIAAGMNSPAFIKSSMMLGCGETEAEVRQTLEDLLDSGCTAVNMGQYLQPTARHFAVVAFIAPERFAQYEKQAYAMGFAFAVAGPFVRSSYRAEALLEALAAKPKGNAVHAV